MTSKEILKKGELTPTWLEHAAFWSGVRRATIAPRSPPRQIEGEHNYLKTSFQYALALSHRPDENWEMFGYFSIWRNDQEHRKPTYSRTCIERLVCILFYLYWTVICKSRIKLRIIFQVKFWHVLSLLKTPAITRGWPLYIVVNCDETSHSTSK